MDGPKVRRESWFAAAILAVGTIAVFDRLHDYGPASAIRRYHNALLENNVVELGRVTSEATSDPNSIELATRTIDLLKQSENFEVARMDIGGSRVRAVVLYKIRNQIVRPDVFVLDREGSSWKVNAKVTLFVRQELFASRP